MSTRMQGLGLQGLKKHPSLIPLFIALSFGCSNAVFCTIRAAFTNPDVTWCIKKNPEPWNAYSDKDYKKFIDVKKRNCNVRNSTIWDLLKN